MSVSCDDSVHPLCHVDSYVITDVRKDSSICQGRAEQSYCCDVDACLVCITTASVLMLRRTVCAVEPICW